LLRLGSWRKSPRTTEIHQCLVWGSFTPRPTSCSKCWALTQNRKPCGEQRPFQSHQPGHDSLLPDCWPLKNTNQQQRRKLGKTDHPITWFEMPKSSNCQGWVPGGWEPSRNEILNRSLRCKSSSKFFTFGKLAILGACGSDPFEYLVRYIRATRSAVFFRVCGRCRYQMTQPAQPISRTCSPLNLQLGRALHRGDGRAMLSLAKKDTPGVFGGARRMRRLTGQVPPHGVLAREKGDWSGEWRSWEKLERASWRHEGRLRHLGMKGAEP